MIIDLTQIKKQQKNDDDIFAALIKAANDRPGGSSDTLSPLQCPPGGVSKYRDFTVDEKKWLAMYWCTTDYPKATEDDIADVQKQLEATANDPNLVITTEHVFDYTIYVDFNNDGFQDGTMAHPFGSVDQALDAASEKQGHIEVNAIRRKS